MSGTGIGVRNPYGAVVNSLIIIVFIGALLIVVGTLFIAPMVVIVTSAVRGRRRGLSLWAALLRPVPLTAVGVLALAGAATIASLGWLPGIFAWDAAEMCASAAGFYSGTPGPSDASWTGIDRQLFPMRQTCRWADGTTYELVPGWLTPALVALVLIALAAFGEAIVRAVGRPRRDPADVPTAGTPLR